MSFVAATLASGERRRHIGRVRSIQIASSADFDLTQNFFRETVRRHMGRLVALGLFERAEDQIFVPTKELREVEIEWYITGFVNLGFRDP
jgi:hypothetical protein